MLVKTVFAALKLQRQAIQLFGAALAVLSYAAQASSLAVSPVRLEIQAPQRAQALQISNSGSEDLHAQVRVLRWSQDGGEEQLVPTNEIVVSPAILRVAPGRPQTVRVIRIQELPVSQERSYRVLVDELPPEPMRNDQSGLTMLLRYSIPVFVKPATTAKQSKDGARVLDLNQIHVQLIAGKDGKSVLQVKNESAQYLRLSHLSTVQADGSTQSLEGGLLGYVLAGQQMRWPLDLPYPLPSELTLKVRFNDDRQARALPLDSTGR